MFINKKGFIVLIVLFIIILGVQTYYLHWVYTGEIHRKEEMAEDYAQLALTTFRKTLDKYEYLTDAIRQGIMSDEDVMEEHFDNYGRWMLANEQAVKAVYLCKDGYINRAYPAKAEKMMLGANLFDDFLWSSDAEHTSELKHMIIIGPVLLHDDSNGFIYYGPVYVQQEEEKRFWGIVLTVLDADIFAQELKKDLVKLDEYSVGFYREVAYNADITDDKGFIMTFGEIKKNKIDIPFQVNGFVFRVVVDRKDNWEVMDEVVPIAISVYGIGMAAWLFVLFFMIKVESDRTIEMQRKLNEAKMEFFSNMSHDMRTPLNGIMGLLEISIAHPEQEERVQENIKKALSAANHLKILINNILDIGRVSVEKIKLEHVPFDLETVCNESCMMVESQAELLGLTITMEQIDIQQLHLLGSPIHLKEILINLYSNAMKYNRKAGKIHTRLSEISRTEDVVVYEFQIQDTGIGMSEEFIKEKLFQKYQKGEQKLQMNHFGTGLGMSIVKELVEEMNGTIQVESTVGMGTIITLKIPFEIDKNYEPPVYEPKSIGNLSDMHILLTDDVKLNLDIEAYILQDKGATVTTACNGTDAVTQFINNPAYTFDVILMDLKMPVMDGYEATKQIRQSGKKDAASIPIIAVTANAFDTDIKRCYKVGMNAHIAKPLDQDRVFQVIQKFSEKKKDNKDDLR